jgi:hypothetical protein
MQLDFLWKWSQFPVQQEDIERIGMNVREINEFGKMGALRRELNPQCAPVFSALSLVSMS